MGSSVWRGRLLDRALFPFAGDFLTPHPPFGHLLPQGEKAMGRRDLG